MNRRICCEVKKKEIWVWFAKWSPIIRLYLNSGIKASHIVSIAIKLELSSCRVELSNKIRIFFFTEWTKKIAEIITIKCYRARGRSRVHIFTWIIRRAMQLSYFFDTFYHSISANEVFYFQIIHYLSCYWNPSSSFQLQIWSRPWVLASLC